MIYCYITCAFKFGVFDFIVENIDDYNISFFIDGVYRRHVDNVVKLSTVKKT